MTQDALIEAVRAKVSDRDLPGPASPQDVAAVEQAVGHPMPPLLKRLYLEVANGGFGHWEAVSLTETDHWFSDCADIHEACHAFLGPESPVPAGLVPLMDRGCGMWAFIDFRTPDGWMWDWDPDYQCCPRHTLLPLGQSLEQWLGDWLRDAAHEGPYPGRAECEESG